jgi:hypothetical protein
MMVLAPAGAAVPEVFANAVRDPGAHDQILARMQQMRGRVALKEGAVRRSELDSNARHRMPGDESSWHLIRLGEEGNVNGCARILVHPNTATFSELRLASSAVAQHPQWREQVRWSVESDLAMAREHKINVVEPGGWVLEEKLRGTSEAISIALSAFAWARLIGSCLAYVTATVRHRSSSMLRRLGADSLYFGGEEIPRYYDSRYACEMELLRLRNPNPHPKFERRLTFMQDLLSGAPVLQAGSLSRSAVAGR